jgi:hypothetical protein
MSNTNIVGIATTGSITQHQLVIFLGGDYITLLLRTNPISIGITGLIVDSGLSSFPSIQRRTFGLRNSGAIELSNLS